MKGLYSAGNLMVALDIARRPSGNIHFVRLGGVFSFGHMPRIVDGQQKRGDIFLSGGVALTLGFGED